MPDGVERAQGRDGREMNQVGIRNISSGGGGAGLGRISRVEMCEG